MKKLLFFTMIGLFAVSCQPAEVTCDCTGTGGTGGGSVTVSGGLSLIDTNLIGHWKNTNTLVNLGTSTNASLCSPVTDFDIYFSPDGLVHIEHTFVSVNGVNSFFDKEYEYKVIDDGILCINDFIIHYEINNGVFTYYHEQNIDLSFACLASSFFGSSAISFEYTVTDYSYYDYYVSQNSLTKQ